MVRVSVFTPSLLLVFTAHIHREMAKLNSISQSTAIFNVAQVVKLLRGPRERER